jgi:hypothetical protein
MPRWEVCQIRSRMLRGASWSRGETWAYQAHLFTLTGEESIVAESDSWETGSMGDEVQSMRFRALDASLGSDGWEPMPIVDVHGSAGSSYSTVQWFFKRQLRDA